MLTTTTNTSRNSRIASRVRRMNALRQNPPCKTRKTGHEKYSRNGENEMNSIFYADSILAPKAEVAGSTPAGCAIYGLM